MVTTRRQGSKCGVLSPGQNPRPSVCTLLHRLVEYDVEIQFTVCIEMYLCSYLLGHACHVLQSLCDDKNMITQSCVTMCSQVRMGKHLYVGCESYCAKHPLLRQMTRFVRELKNIKENQPPMNLQKLNQIIPFHASLGKVSETCAERGTVHNYNTAHFVFCICHS